MKTVRPDSLLLLVFALVVNPSSALRADGPTISPIPNLTTSEDTPVGGVSFTIADAETPAASLHLTAVSSNPVLLPVSNISLAGIGNARVVFMVPATNSSGTTTITITAQDADGNVGATSFLLTVTAVNDPPTLSALPNLVIDENAGPQTVSLSGITSGAGNEAQTLTVSAVSSDPSVLPNPTVTYISPGSTGSLRIVPKEDAFGVSTVTVSVQDGVTTGSQSFQVTVNARLQIAMAENDAVLTWAATNGMLQQTDVDQSQWTDVPDATSPYRVALSGTRFYRLRQK
jgi:hypothetical protein